MWMSIILLLCFGMIMLGMVGKRSKEAKQAQNTLNLTAFEYLKDHRMVMAFQNFEKSASIGNAEAAFWCGFLCAMGYVERPDYKSAAFWFAKAMNQGHLGASLFASLLLAKKQINPSVDQDTLINSVLYIVIVYERAPHQHSVEQLLTSSQYLPFSGFATYGWHLKQFYIQSSREQQDAYAYVHAMYMAGHLLKDLALADLERGKFNPHAWHNAIIFLSRCEQLRYLDSSLLLAQLIEVAAQCPALTTLSQVDSSSKIGVFQGHLGSTKYQPSFDYSITQQLLSQTPEQLWQLVFAHYDIAVTQGVDGALYELGEHYLQGRGVAPNITKAIECFTQSKSVPANLRLGEMYQFGYGVMVDGLLAVNYYHACINGGFTEFAHGGDFSKDRDIRIQAVQHLVDIYHTGLGTIAPSPELEFYWTRIAAFNQLAPYQLRLAAMYNSGIGCPRDIELAVLWYTKAANKGSEEALQALYQLQEVEPLLVRQTLAQSDEFLDYESPMWFDMADDPELDPELNFKRMRQSVKNHA